MRFWKRKEKRRRVDATLGYWDFMFRIADTTPERIPSPEVIAKNVAIVSERQRLGL